MIKHTITVIAAAAMLTLTPVHSIAQTPPKVEVALMWDQVIQVDHVIIEYNLSDGQFTEIARVPATAPGTSGTYTHTNAVLNKQQCYRAINTQLINGTQAFSKPSNEVCLTPVYVEGVVNFRGVLNLK